MKNLVLARQIFDLEDDGKIAQFHFSTDSSECPQEGHASMRNCLGSPQDPFKPLCGTQKWFTTISEKIIFFIILYLKTTKTAGNALKVLKMKIRENSIFRTPF